MAISKHEKRENRKAQNIKILKDNGLDFKAFDSKNIHLLVEDVHFWPSTERYYFKNEFEQHNGKGINNLLAVINRIRPFKQLYERYKLQLELPNT